MSENSSSIRRSALAPGGNSKRVRFDVTSYRNAMLTRMIAHIGVQNVKFAVENVVNDNGDSNAGLDPLELAMSLANSQKVAHVPPLCFGTLPINQKDVKPPQSPRTRSPRQSLSHTVASFRTNSNNANSNQFGNSRQSLKSPTADTKLPVAKLDFEKSAKSEVAGIEATHMAARHKQHAYNGTSGNSTDTDTGTPEPQGMAIPSRVNRWPDVSDYDSPGYDSGTSTQPTGAFMHRKYNVHEFRQQSQIKQQGVTRSGSLTDFWQNALTTSRPTGMAAGTGTWSVPVSGGSASVSKDYGPPSFSGTLPTVPSHSDRQTSRAMKHTMHSESYTSNMSYTMSSGLAKFPQKLAVSTTSSNVDYRPHTSFGSMPTREQRFSPPYDAYDGGMPLVGQQQPKMEPVHAPIVYTSVNHVHTAVHSHTVDRAGRQWTSQPQSQGHSAVTTNTQSYHTWSAKGASTSNVDESSTNPILLRQSASMISAKLSRLVPAPIDTTSQSGVTAVPAGLPSPKPKHHLREQLLSAGLEPRSPTYNAAGKSASSSWLLMAANAGASSVMARVLELEKRPPPLQQIYTQPHYQDGSISTTLETVSSVPETLGNGPNSVQYVQQPAVTSIKALHEETVYRTKPVIHVNLNLSAPPAGRKKQASSAGAGIEPLSILDGAQPFPIDISVPSVSGTPSPPIHQASVAATATNAPVPQLPVAQQSPKSPKCHSVAQNDVVASVLDVQGGSIVRAGCAKHIPRFHFAHGRGPEKLPLSEVVAKVKLIFGSLPAGRATPEDMADITLACSYSLYWKAPLFHACSRYADIASSSVEKSITFEHFEQYWKELNSAAHDESSRFVHTLAGTKRNHLLREDFELMIQDIIDTFPGFEFLRAAPEFYSRYVQTVISRIFFEVNRSWSGRITAAEMRKANFLKVLRSLDTASDINLVTDYFSYEHFYVVYCKFWELDTDHDLYISAGDLARHGGNAISRLVIERIFSGVTGRGRAHCQEMQSMSYADFVYFLLAEEHKAHPSSIEYWFRVLDTDSDGCLSLFELETFYRELERMMLALAIEPLKFTDVVCQLLDMVHPQKPDQISLMDIKRSGMAVQFFNTFVNVHKYFEQEVNEGTNERLVEWETGETMSSWDRFCAEEYEVLMRQDEADRDEQDTDPGESDRDGGKEGGAPHAQLDCDSDDDDVHVIVPP